jgi:alkylated DNA repair dioxygenase AlkB
MELFPAAPAMNLLPCDGLVTYHGAVFKTDESNRHLARLIAEIPWEHDETVIFGKRIVTKRKVAWFADGGRSYAYSGTMKLAHPWTEHLLSLKSTAERVSGATCNSCLLNLYHDGGEGMGWHSDDERSLAPSAPILSMSFGAERKFSFRHKRTRETVSVSLENGSLLMMAGETQIHWHHQLPKSAKVSSPRVNLTFRSVI